MIGYGGNDFLESVSSLPYIDQDWCDGRGAHDDDLPPIRLPQEVEQWFKWAIPFNINEFVFAGICRVLFRSYKARIFCFEFFDVLRNACYSVEDHKIGRIRIRVG